MHVDSESERLNKCEYPPMINYPFNESICLLHILALQAFSRNWNST